MKRMMFALAAGAAFLAAPAANAAIFIGVSVNGGAITQVATDGGTGSANYLATTGGYFYNVGATGFPLLPSPQMLTQSINIQSVGGSNGTVDIYITQTDNASFVGGLLSTFTSNTISGANATLRSYYNTNNALWGNGGTQLHSASFNGTATSAAGVGGLNLTSPWSETVRYTLTFTGGNGSNFNGTANLSGVPEPTTWAMMMLGFGAMGAMIRRRKTTTSARIRFA